MNSRIQSLFDARDSDDRDASYRALVELFALAEKPVNWSYDVWDRMLSQLKHSDGHHRAFAAQMLARLAISDPDKRMLRDFPRIAAVMKDEKTVTARHTLQSLWRIGLAGPKQAELVLSALEKRFRECAKEKNGSLWRTDTIECMARLAKATGDHSIEARADALIQSERDEAAQKKQRAAWRKGAPPGARGGEHRTRRLRGKV